MNPENLKPFKPGDDPRRNTEGRPRKLPSIDKLLIEVLGDEEDDKSEAYAILRALATKAKKGDTKAAEILLDRAFGKAKQSIDLKAEVKAAVSYTGIEIIKPDEPKV